MQNPYSLKSRCKITQRKIPLPPPSWKPSDFFFPTGAQKGDAGFLEGSPGFRTTDSDTGTHPHRLLLVLPTVC